VTIENRGGQRFAERRDHWRTNRNVRDKMPVHDVYVQQRASASQRLFSVRCEIGEIGGQNRRREFNQPWQSFRSWPSV
jgi:hypothetical protein